MSALLLSSYHFPFFHFSQKLSKTKSSKELYREAAQMLGMSCEFTENCRCLDCQVRCSQGRQKHGVLKAKIFFFLFLIFLHTRRADILTVMMTMILTRFQIYQASSKPRNLQHVLTTEIPFTIVTVRTSTATMATMECVKMLPSSNINR